MDRPDLEVADIFRSFGPAYRQRHRLRLEEHKAMRAIEQCRTAALGGHVDACLDCGALQISYNSCRHRACPKCQGEARQKWVEAREAELLPIEYFHVVFTLPSALNPLLHYNRVLMLNLLFQAVSQTLLEFGRRHLEGEIGAWAVLHTWGQTLCEHNHLHTIVTGGALSADGQRWTPCRMGFLFPVSALAAVFRGKYLAALKQAHTKGQLRFGGEVGALWEAEDFRRFVRSLYTHDWIVYAKRPFAGAREVVRYLGRYTHRGPISNQRLLSLEGDQVSFAYKNSRAGGAWETMELSVAEFIRRYLVHVLPSGFVRIRYYGLYAAARRKKSRARCRELLGVAPGEAAGEVGREATEADAAEAEHEGQRCCEVCGSERRVRQREWHAGERVPKWVEAVAAGLRPAGAAGALPEVRAA
jgi:hypothetical protein